MWGRSGNETRQWQGEELVHAIKLVRSNVRMYRLPLFAVRRSVSTATVLRMPIKVNTAHLHGLCYNNVWLTWNNQWNNFLYVSVDRLYCHVTKLSDVIGRRVNVPNIYVDWWLAAISGAAWWPKDKSQHSRALCWQEGCPLCSAWGLHSILQPGMGLTQQSQILVHAMPKTIPGESLHSCLSIVWAWPSHMLPNRV